MADSVLVDELGEDEPVLLARWVAACAQHALPVFEDGVPGDRRPREAIRATLGWGLPERSAAHLRERGRAAWAAGQDAGDPAAADAARAASAATGAVLTRSGAGGLRPVRALLMPAVHAASALETADAAGLHVRTAAEDEIAWAARHAPLSVRRAVAELPAPRFGRSRTGCLLRRLHEALRE